MRIIADATPLMEGVQYVEAIDTVVVDPDAVLSDVSIFGRADSPETWSRWWTHRAHQRGWHRARWMLLVTAARYDVARQWVVEGLSHD